MVGTMLTWQIWLAGFAMAIRYIEMVDYPVGLPEGSTLAKAIMVHCGGLVIGGSLG